MIETWISFLSSINIGSISMFTSCLFKNRLNHIFKISWPKRRRLLSKHFQLCILHIVWQMLQKTKTCQIHVEILIINWSPSESFCWFITFLSNCSQVAFFPTVINSISVLNGWIFLKDSNSLVLKRNHIFLFIHHRFWIFLGTSEESQVHTSSDTPGPSWSSPCLPSPPPWPSTWRTGQPRLGPGHLHTCTLHSGQQPAPRYQGCI